MRTAYVALLSALIGAGLVARNQELMFLKHRRSTAKARIRDIRAAQLAEAVRSRQLDLS
jgi:hypothetical protein